MAQVTLRKTAPNSNPEYSTITLDNMDDKQIEAYVEALVADPDFHPGWLSKGEPEYWDKPTGIEIVEIIK